MLWAALVSHEIEILHVQIHTCIHSHLVEDEMKHRLGILAGESRLRVVGLATNMESIVV